MTASIVRSISVSSPYVEHAQYHQGCSADTILGVGSTPREALEDALEQLAQREDLVLSCAEPDADTELGADADRYLADELIQEELVFRSPRYWIEHRSVTGCHPITRENVTMRETRAEALADLRAHVDALRARGFETWQDLGTAEVEVLEPEGCIMIPAEVGTLVLVDDEDETARENERTEEHASEHELHVYVELDLELVDEEDERPDEDVPTEDAIARLPEVQREAERQYRATSANGGRDYNPKDVAEANVAHYAQGLARRIRAILKDGQLEPREVLEELGELLGMDVEGLSEHVGGPPGLALDYLNAGDAYRATICTDGERFWIGSWGEALEAREEELASEDGILSCAYCGEYGEPVRVVDVDGAVRGDCGACGHTVLDRVGLLLPEATPEEVREARERAEENTAD